MSIDFIWPGHSIDPDNVLSCTSEAGLIVDVPVADDANMGALRLRSSGNPYSEHTLDLYLVGGGNPTGYSSSDNFYGAGASIRWKESTDASDEWRGYNDTIYLVNAEMPFSHLNGGVSPFPSSHPRELPDGKLGLLYGADGNSYRFARYEADGTVNHTNISQWNPGSYQPDFVVLPSGRLVALIQATSYYSDDNGTTWNVLGENALSITSALYYQSLEYVPVVDMLVLVKAAPNALVDSEVWVSRDGGVHFTQVGTGGPHQGGATCVTPDGTVLFATPAAAPANVIAVLPIAPGGGFGEAVLTTVASNTAGGIGWGAPGIVCRDDGTIWVFGMNSDATSINMDANVSRDGGATWEEPANTLALWDTDFAAAVGGYIYTQFGTWNGKVVGVGHTVGTTGSDYNHHLLTFGGWDTINDVKRDLSINFNGLPYEHVYVPIDYPDSMGWARVNVAAGATVTNAQPGPLKIVSTVANNTDYRHATDAFWTGVVGETRRLRLRAKVNSGGSLANNVARLAFAMNDGVNEQIVVIRFATTDFRVLDGPGNILATRSVDLTDWVEFWIAYKHDSPAGQGELSVWFRAIGDTFPTNALANGVVAEQVGVSDYIRFGGTSVASASDWEITYLGVADDDNDWVDNTAIMSPESLAPRALSAAVDFRLLDGINLGGFNGVGIPGDTFTLATTYSYGKESVWREMRPSRHVRSAADNVQWDLVFDAGAGHVFHADTLALVGINFRTCNWRMHTTLAFPGGSTVNENLDSAYESAAGGAGSAGMFVPAVDPSWRKDQFRTNSARRWFLEDSAGAVFEIIGNDTDRLYIEGTPAAGAWVVFGDRAGVQFTAAHVRYARLRVSAQQTADDYYRLGTLITDIRLALSPAYAHNFTDRVEARVTVHESTSGYRSGAKLGPRRQTLSIQWTPLNRYQTDFALQIEDFYNAVDSTTRPFVFWRDSTDQSTIQLVRVSGTYARPNERGELGTALASVDQLVLEEEL